MQSFKEFIKEEIEINEDKTDVRYVESELNKLGNVDEYGARVVITVGGKSTKNLMIKKDFLNVFMKWAKKQGLDKEE